MTALASAGRRLHPATFAIRTIRAAPQYLLGIPTALAVGSDLPLRYVFMAGGVAMLAAALFAYLHWRRFRYSIGARELVIETGLIGRKRRVIPFDRIQDIDIERGPLSRLFGVAAVKIETGGSAKDEGKLDSVGLADAHVLREQLRRHAAPGDQELVEREEAEAEPAEPVLFRMDARRLLLAGLFNFSLFYFAFIFAGNEYLQIFGIDLFSLDWVEPARALAAAATWTATVLAVLLLGVVTVLASTIRTVARDYGFTVTRAASGYRRRRGLFTLSEVVIPFRRVQLLLLRAGPVARAFGWWRLDLQTLGSDGAKASHQNVMPLGRVGEALAIAGEVHPSALPADEDYIRVSKRHILRQTLRASALLSTPFVVASIRWPALLPLILFLPLVVGWAAIEWKHSRYCLGATHLYVRRGFFARRLWMIPYARIQALRLDEGPLRHLLGLKTVTVDTAGTSYFSAPAVANLKAHDADALAQRLLIAHREAKRTLRSGT